MNRTTALESQRPGRSPFGAVRPDLRSARRWTAVLRRIDRVVVAETTDGHVCTLHGVGHRLPVRRRISLATALALADLGVPVSVASDPATSHDVDAGRATERGSRR